MGLVIEKTADDRLLVYDSWTAATTSGTFIPREMIITEVDILNMFNEIKRTRTEEPSIVKYD